MLTIAYIGNGKSTNRYHLPFIKAMKDKVKVKKIFVRHFDFKWKKQENIVYTNSLGEIWNDKEIDLVVITTPVSSHYDYIKEALSRGKNVLCEKPFVKTEKEAEELFSLAKEKNLILECYQNRRYDSDFLTIQKVIESKILGDIFEVEMHFDYYRPEIPEYEKIASYENSFLYSHACHSLDQAISYFGIPERYELDIRALYDKERMNDYFDIDFFYSQLKVSIKSSYFRLIPRPSFVVYGKKGTFVKQSKDRQEEFLKHGIMPTDEGFGEDLSEHYGFLTYVDDTGEVFSKKIKTEKGNYGYVYERLYKVIKNNARQLVTPVQTLAQIKILEQGWKQFENQK